MRQNKKLEQFGEHVFAGNALDKASGVPEDVFWSLAGESIRRYQAQFPEMAERFAIFNLFHEEYPRLCLNRLRLFTHGYADDHERPVLNFQGMVDNPLVQFECEVIV